MSDAWKRPPREGVSWHLRFNIWLLRQPWVVVAIVALQLFRIWRSGLGVWNVLMLAATVWWAVQAFQNVRTEGKVERALFPGAW